MAQDEIQLLFKSIGLKANIQDLKILQAALKTTGNSLNFDRFNKSISSISKNLNIAKAKVTEVLGRFRVAIESLPKETRLRFIADFKSLIRIPKDVKSILKTDPIELPFKLDASNLRNTIKEIGIQIRKIEDPISRVKTAFQTIETLQKQIVKIQKNQNITAKQRNALVAEYKKLLASVPTLLGVGTKQNVDALGKTKTGLGELRTLETLRTNASSQAAAFQKVNQQQIETKKSADALDKTNQKFGQNIGVAVGKLIRYRVAFFAMRGAIRATKASMEEFINLQFKLAELEIVIDRQTQSIERYRKAAFKLSKDFGVAIGDIVSTMKVWAQTGLQQNEVLDATIATLVGVNALSSTTSQVVEALTAAIFTYGVAVEDNIQVLSKWLAVQRKFPITAQDLANSLKIVGAAAQVVGVDLDDLAGFVAAIGSATRKSGAAVGQSLKTIFARLPRKQVIQAFEGINISVLRTSSQLRDLDNILDDLSLVWDDLSTVQKANISTTLGGIRRYADFIALMDNYDIKLKAVIESQNATTEAFDANDIILGTVQKAWARAKASVAEFSIAVGQALLGPLSTGIALLTAFTKAINSVSRIFPRATAGFIAFVATFAGLGIIGIGLIVLFGKMRLALLRVAGATIGVTVGWQQLTFRGIILTAVNNGLIVTIRSLFVALGTLNVVIGGLVILLSIAAAVWTFFGDGATEASQAVSSLTVSLEQAFSTTQSQLKGLESEKDLLKGFATDIKKLGDEFIKLGKEEDKIGQKKAFDKLIAKFKLLPNTFKPVNEAVDTFNDLLKIGESNVQGLTLALKEYKEEALLVAKELEELSKRQLKVLVASAGRDIVFLNADIKKIRDVQAAIAEVDNTLQSFKITAGSVSDVPASFGKIGDTFSEDIFKTDKVKTLKDIKDTFDFIVKEVSSEFRGAQKRIKGTLERDNREIKLDEVIVKGAILDDDRVDSSLDNLAGAYARAVKTVTKGQGTLEELISREPKEQGNFIGTLSEEIATSLRLIDAEGSITGQLETKVVLLRGQVLKVRSELLTLGDIIENVDGGFRIGRKLPSDAVRTIKSLKDVIETVKNYKERFENLKKIAGFEDILNIDDFKLEQDIKFVKAYNELILKNIDLSARLVAENVTLAPLFVFETNEKGEQVIKGVVKEYDELFKASKAITDLALGESTNREFLTGKYEDNTRAIKETALAINDLASQELLADATQNIENARRRNKENKSASLVLNTLLEKKLLLIDAQISRLRRVAFNEDKIIALENKKLEAIKETALLDASLGATQKERTATSIAGLKRIKDESLRILAVTQKIEIDKIIAKAAKNAVVFRDAIIGAFSNIPDDIGQNAERRKDLQEELRVAEFDLQETRREGDKKSIADAQHRVDLINFELESYTRGLAEIKALTLSIFDSLGTAFFDNLVEEFANSLNLVKVGGAKIGDIVAKALGTASNQFASDWKSEADLHVIALESVFTAHVNGLRDALGLARINTVGGAVTGDSNDTDKKEIPKELKGISKSLRDGFSLIATIAATSITGASGPGARTGSQFGSLVGGAAASKFLGPGALAAVLGGPIGIVAGGIIGGLLGGLFDKGDKPQEPLTRALETNTTATLSNTIALKELDKAIFNAPTRFNVPAFAGSFGAPITIQISGANSPSDVADEVSRILNEQFDNDSSTVGSRGFVPV